MKTWEIIKELTENPGKKFHVKDNKHLIVNIKATGAIDFRNVSQNRDYNPSIEWEWEEIKEPMTFMDAVQTGRYIKSVDPIITKASSGYDFYEGYQSLSDFLYRLGNDFSSKEIRCILFDAEFYVE